MADENSTRVGIGEAGPNDPEARSDAWVRVERRDAGGLEIAIESKVAAMYGEAIRDQTSAVLAACAIEHASVRVIDRGALPFALAARVEAAARRSGAVPEAADARPPRRSGTSAPSARDRRRRSRLYLPGNEPKFMVNAGLHGTDGLILDLEDSVHSSQKDAARLLVRNALRCLDFGGAERMVRINPGETGLLDLEAVVPEDVDLILVPKVEDERELQRIDQRIGEIQARIGVRRSVWLMPILETARGVENAYAIATANERVVALTLGLEDYTADLGVPKTREGEESRYARERVVVAARAAGLQAIDSVYGDVGDEEGLSAWAGRARAMGYTGMGCVHPRQIRVVHAAFAPSVEELEKARRIVAAFREAEAEGRAVVSLGSKMIDPPVVERALRLVREAEELGIGEKGAFPSEGEV